ARGVSGARSRAGIPARAGAAGLVVLDGTPSLPSGLAAGAGAGPSSRAVAQFRPRASRADDVGCERRHSRAGDLQRAVEYRPQAIFVRTLRTTLMRAGDAGLLHDPAPARDLRADEGAELRGRRAVVGQHADAADLLLHVGHGHDRLQLAMQPRHDIL